jgi:putative ABC transport system permease protein
MSLMLKMSWRNVWRNKRRSIITMAAIAFCTMLALFMLAYMRGAYGAMIDALVQANIGHLQVQKEGYLADRKLNDVVRNPQEVIDAIAMVPEVKAVGPRVQIPLLVFSGNRTAFAIGLGVDAEREPSISNLPHSIREGEFFAVDDNDGVVVGTLLAKNLQLKIGSELDITGQSAMGSIIQDRLIVRGFVRTGINDLDRNFVIIPLARAQEMAALGDSVHALNVMTTSWEHVWTMQGEINQALKKLGREELVALTWSEVSPGIKQAIQIDAGSGWIFFCILLVIVGFGILNTLVMAFLERMREYGVMLALGMTPGRGRTMILYESVFMAFPGIVAGIGLGMFFAWLAATYGIDIRWFGEGVEEMMAEFGFPMVIIYAKLEIWMIALSASLSFGITLLAALYPARKVSHIEPIDALRFY